MPVVVAVFGFLILSIGALGFFSPAGLTRFLSIWEPGRRLYAAVIFRILFGVVLLLAAPECRFPIVVGVTGLVALVAAVVLGVVGARRFESFVQWWLARPAAFIRAWAGVATAFGGLLIYAAV